MLPSLKRLLTEFNDPLLWCQEWKKNKIHLLLWFSPSESKSLVCYFCFHLVVYLVYRPTLLPLYGWLRARSAPWTTSSAIPQKAVTPGQPRCVHLGCSPISERHQKHKTWVHVSFSTAYPPYCRTWIASDLLSLDSLPRSLISSRSVSLYTPQHLLCCYHDLSCMPILKYHSDCLFFFLQMRTLLSFSTLKISLEYTDNLCLRNRPGKQPLTSWGHLSCNTAESLPKLRPLGRWWWWICSFSLEAIVQGENTFDESLLLGASQ